MPPTRLGVDFGTSHTVAVLHRDGAAVPLLFDSSPILPSAVYAGPDERLLVGAEALNAARLQPARCEPHPKRRIDDGHVLLGDKEYSVEDLFAAVLGRVRQDCERVVGSAPVTVTLTHPAVWGSARRLVLEDAAAAAGFGDVRLVPEPVAAARYFTHVLRHEVPEGFGIMVADLGGGTFDASVVAGAPSGFTVLAMDGIDDLGGVDIDHALLSLLGERFGDRPEWTRLAEPRELTDRRARRALYDDVRTAKELLSRRARADLPIPLLDSDTHFTRDELESLTRPLLERAVRMARSVARASRLPRERMSGALLVGGASRMPLVASMLHQALGTAPVVLEQPELVVAQGATLTEQNGAIAMTTPPVSPPHAAGGQVSPPGVTPVSPVPGPMTPPHGIATAPATAMTPPMPVPQAAPTPPRVKPPGAVRSARLLMWSHTAMATVLWAILFGVLVDEGGQLYTGSDPDPTSYIGLVALSPIMFVLGPVALAVTTIQLHRRVAGARGAAVFLNQALAVGYVLIAAFTADLGDDYLWQPLVMLLLFAPVAVGSALTLRSESAVRWLDPVPRPIGEQTAFPPPVRVARVCMWVNVGIGLAWTVVLFTALADGAYARRDFGSGAYLVNDFFFVMAIVLPFLAVMCLVALGSTAFVLRGRRPIARILAITANAVAIAYYGFSLVGITQFQHDEPAIICGIGIAIMAPSAIAAASLLSTRTARRALTARAAPG